MWEELCDVALEGALALAILAALAAVLTSAPSSSSREAASYSFEKALGTVSLSLARTSSAFILVVTAWDLEPYRNS